MRHCPICIDKQQNNTSIFFPVNVFVRISQNIINACSCDVTWNKTALSVAKNQFIRLYIGHGCPNVSVKSITFSSYSTGSILPTAIAVPKTSVMSFSSLYCGWPLHLVFVTFPTSIVFSNPLWPQHFMFLMLDKIVRPMLWHM